MLALFGGLHGIVVGMLVKPVTMSSGPTHAGRT